MRDAGPAAERGADQMQEGTKTSFHDSAIVIDMHNDVTLRLVDDEGFDFGIRDREGHTDLLRMREGGLDAEFFAVWVKPRAYRGEAAWVRANQMLDAIHDMVHRHPSRVRLALTAADIRAAEAEARISVLIGVEGAHALGDFGSDEVVLARIRELHGRGARYITLTWMTSNPLAGSSGDAGRGKGLTPLGRRAVALMNDLGMMVDVSHVSDPTFYDVLETTRLPVIASHSATRAKSDHYRNVTDDMLRAVAKNGGVVCTNFYSGFLDAEWMAERRRARRTGTEMKLPPPSLETLVDHIAHTVEVAGVDHACLGSDFDGVGSLPQGLEDVSDLSALTEALQGRGYSEQELRKVLGLNVLRVMEANERGSLNGSRPPGPS